MAPAVNVALSGDIVVDRRSDDIVIDVGTYPPGGDVSYGAWISRGGYESARLTSIDRVSGTLTAVPGPGEESNRHAIAVRLEGVAPTEPGGFQSVFNATMIDGPWHESRIVVQGVVRSRWRFPQDVYLGFVNRGASTTQTIRITSPFQPSEAAVVRRVVPSASGPFSTAARIVSKREIEVDVTLEGGTSTGAVTAPLTVDNFGNDGLQETIVLRLYGNRLPWTLAASSRRRGERIAVDDVRSERGTVIST